MTSSPTPFLNRHRWLRRHCWRSTVSLVITLASCRRHGCCVLVALVWLLPHAVRRVGLSLALTWLSATPLSAAANWTPLPHKEVAPEITQQTSFSLLFLTPPVCELCNVTWAALRASITTDSVHVSAAIKSLIVTEACWFTGPWWRNLLPSNIAIFVPCLVYIRIAWHTMYTLVV